MNRLFSRRIILRGAGVALALPWLESLVLPEKAASAQAVGKSPKRYLPVFLPNGASENWKPAAVGAGAEWALSPVLDVFGALKAKMQVLTNLENGSAFNASGSSGVEPSHGRQPGAFLTCVDPDAIRKELGDVGEANEISLDQIMATHAAFRGKTALPSLQLGLSTVESYCDGKPCSNSRSISWSGKTTPMYKMVDPLAVFNKLTGVIDSSGGNGPSAPDPETEKRLARNKSILDAVLENASRTRGKLGKADQLRMEEFLTSVREVEQRVTSVSAGMGGLSCAAIQKPSLGTIGPNSFRQNTESYDKGRHADAMNDLIVMAFRCDATRIITHMLEDERSEFTYDHVKMRTFSATGSAEANGTCPEYHGGGQHGSQDAFASIVRWNAGKVAELATKLDAIQEADGSSILDNTVVFFAGAMHGSNHACDRLPVALIGGGALGLRQDQHLDLVKRPLRDLHYTMLQRVFEMQDVTQFGRNLTGAPLTVLDETMA